MGQAPQATNAGQTHARVTLDIETEVIYLIEKLRVDLGVKSRGTIINLLLKELLLPEVAIGPDKDPSSYTLGRGILRTGLSRRIRPRRRRDKREESQPQPRGIMQRSDRDIDHIDARHRLVESIRKIRQELGIDFENKQ